jgi:hypothetical protein
LIVIFHVVVPYSQQVVARIIVDARIVVPLVCLLPFACLMCCFDLFDVVIAV